MRMPLKSKKGQVGQLMPLVLSLVTIGITLAIGFLILSEIGANDTVRADLNASSAINQTVDALSDIPTWLPIIVITVIGALLLGLVSFFGRTR